ncbi:MFS transporter [Thermotoga profunda]|uniref:MFS transporter n=1 Tax=Thermotoga profunda TaxID=1508420 RepID=UPI000597AEDE|nr:MFS transporter [Thermotoga profunda]
MNGNNLSLVLASFFRNMTVLNYDMLLQFRMRELSSSLFSIGLLSTITSAIGSLSSPFWGALSDELKSRKRTLLLPLMVAFLILPFYSFSIKPFHFFLVGILFTFFSSVFEPICTAIMIESSRFRMNIAVSILNAANSFGMGLGRIIISPLLNAVSVVWTMNIMYFLSLFVVFFSFFAPDVEHKRYEIIRTNLQRIFSAITSKRILKKNNLWAMYLGSFLRQLGVGGTFALIGVYLTETVGLSKAQSVLFASANPFLQVPSHIFFGWLAEKVSSKNIAVIGMFLSGLGTMLFAVSGNYIMVLLAYAISGLGFGAFINGATNFVSQNVPENRRAEFLGLLTSARSFGSLFGPLIAGLLSEISFVLMFAVMATIMFFGSLLTMVFCQR